MKSLHTYISEKLIIKQKQIITPYDKQELVRAILDHFKSHNGDLNDIDVSELKEEDFYRLFYDLRVEIKKNKITEIDILKWKLKELYCFNDTGMFQSCETLETIILPECLETIDYFTFYNCRKLENIFIPNSVTSIGNSITTGNLAFHECPNLTITVPNERVKRLVWNSGFNGKIIINK